MILRNQNTKRKNSPPIKSFELDIEDMHRIAWKIGSLKVDTSEVICLDADCLRIFPTLLKKAIANT